MRPTWLGLPTRRRPGQDRAVQGEPAQDFPDAARRAVADSQLRRNLRKATTTIRAKRARAVGELDDWQQLRAAGKAIKDQTLASLHGYLEQFEAAATAAGARVHWARDAAEANAAVAQVVRAHGASEVVKVKSMATEEIGLNAALAAEGITAYETDLAELIVQLGNDRPSHILVPAIHKNRSEVRELFLRTIPNVDEDLTDEPGRLAGAVREHLHRKFLSAKVGVSGANFAVAETGSLIVVESEGNGRMCLTLPDVLVSVVGIEKIVPTWADLEVFLQLLPRSSTGERMNPYTTVWTGVHEGDGPREVHVVLLDNGRTRVLADDVGRQALRCIRCSACLNVCPVYERVGGHAYHSAYPGSVYPGPIGAILTPQQVGVQNAASLPYASSLCGACYEVCPVAIDIPEVLVHLRNEVVEAGGHRTEAAAMRAMAWVFADERRFAAAQRAARLAPLGRLVPDPLSPLYRWTSARDLPPIPAEPFRAWWRRERGGDRT
jgi:L-lactate dehydrogenase complex protein LldF